jgi:hypothetical protein
MKGGELAEYTGSVAPCMTSSDYTEPSRRSDMQFGVCLQTRPKGPDVHTGLFVLPARVTSLGDAEQQQSLVYRDLNSSDHCAE